MCPQAQSQGGPKRPFPGLGERVGDVAWCFAIALSSILWKSAKDGAVAVAALGDVACRLGWPFPPVFPRRAGHPSCGVAPPAPTAGMRRKGGEERECCSKKLLERTSAARPSPPPQEAGVKAVAPRKWRT